MSVREVHQIPDWNDNYVYLAHGPETGSTAVVDPAEAGPALKARSDAIDRMRAAGQPTVPSTPAEELATNPFPRADDSGVAAAVGMAGADPVAVFAEVRSRKDNF